MKKKEACRRITVLHGNESRLAVSSYNRPEPFFQKRPDISGNIVRDSRDVNDPGFRRPGNSLKA